MLTSAQYQRGLSLIELMVAVTLVSIVMMLAMPNLTGWIQNRQIRTAAETINTGVQLARNEAIKRNRNVKFELTAGNGWLVGCDPPDTSTGDDGQPNCPDTLQRRDAQPSSANAVVTTAETVASTGAAAASPVFAGTLLFTPLGRVAGASSPPLTGSLPAGNLAKFLVTNPTGGTCAASGGRMRCLSVVVSGAGQIRMCDPAVASGDSRAC